MGELDGALVGLHQDPVGERAEHPDRGAAVDGVGAEQGVRVVVLAADQPVHLAGRQRGLGQPQRPGGHGGGRLADGRGRRCGYGRGRGRGHGGRGGGTGRLRLGPSGGRGVALRGVRAGQEGGRHGAGGAAWRVERRHGEDLLGRGAESGEGRRMRSGGGSVGAGAGRGRGSGGRTGEAERRRGRRGGPRWGGDRTGLRGGAAGRARIRR